MVLAWRILFDQVYMKDDMIPQKFRCISHEFAGFFARAHKAFSTYIDEALDSTIIS